MTIDNLQPQHSTSQRLAIEPLLIIIGGLLIGDYPLRGVIAHFPHSRFIDINNKNYDQIKSSLLVLVADSQRPGILIGYSCGGLIILKLLSEVALNVDKIILVNSTPYFLEDKHWHGIKRQDFEKLNSRLIKQSFTNFCSYFHQLCFYPESIPKSTINTPLATKAMTQYWLDFLYCYDLRSVLTKIIHPTMLLYSKLDVLSQINHFDDNPQLRVRILKDSTHGNPNQIKLLYHITEFLNA